MISLLSTVNLENSTTMFVKVGAEDARCEVSFCDSKVVENIVSMGLENFLLRCD